jgi:hypothetical protein
MIPLGLIAALVQHICQHEGDGAILIFLPGWDDISKVHDLLEKLPESRDLKLFPLHGSMPTAQQRGIFLPPPPGLRKVVIATNIAESSITIDDVVFVIDSGKHKEKTYGPPLSTSLSHVLKGAFILLGAGVPLVCSPCPYCAPIISSPCGPTHNARLASMKNQCCYTSQWCVIQREG